MDLTVVSHTGSYNFVPERVIIVCFDNGAPSQKRGWGWKSVAPLSNSRKKNKKEKQKTVKACWPRG